MYNPDDQYLTFKCTVLGQLFVQAQQCGYDMDTFVDAFMQSQTAEILDTKYSPYDGRSVAYLIEDASDVAHIPNPHIAPKYNESMLDWIGWVYRRWNWTRGESSKAIQAQAPFECMKSFYPFHVMSFDMAIDRIKEAISGQYM